MKQLRKPTPLVLNTQMAALTESFGVEASDSLEQWWYANNGVYMPNRATTPLVLTPTISVYDPDTKTTYTPSFYLIEWYVLDGTESKITNTIDSTEANYVILQNGSLRVKKNVPGGQAITIRCEADYIDPRDVSTTHHVTDIVTLATNRDATTVFDNVNILSEKNLSYDPINDSSSIFTLQAQIMRAGEDITRSASNLQFVWEVKILDEIWTLTENELFYVSGLNSDTLTIDALYMQSGMEIVLRIKDSTTNVYLPSRSIVAFNWDAPKISATAYSPQGSSVRYGDDWKAFGVVVNTKKEALSEPQKNANFIMKWKKRDGASSTETNMGWGGNIGATSEELISQSGSTLIWPEVYFIGHARLVKYNGNVVKYGNAVVTMRMEEEY